MPIRISRPVLLAGTIGATLTCTGAFWSNTAIGSVLGDILVGWGIVIASMPFGGLHNDPPVYLVFALGALLNGLLWGGIASVAISIIRRLRFQRTLCRGGHLTWRCSRQPLFGLRGLAAALLFGASAAELER